MITRAEIVVAYPVREEFEKIYDFVITNSDTATAYNLNEMWQIKYLKKDDDFEILSDEWGVTEDYDLELIFEELIKERITDILSYRIDDDGDIIIDFPFTYPWKNFEDEIREVISNIEYDFLSNAANEIVDQIYLMYAKDNAEYSFSECRLIILVTDEDSLEKHIITYSQDYAENSELTSRQVEVLIKKIFKITLSNTERGILAQAREKYQKAKQVLNEEMFTEILEY